MRTDCIASVSYTYRATLPGPCLGSPPALTLLGVAGLAPAATSARMTSRWPFAAAQYTAVHPFCKGAHSKDGYQGAAIRVLGRTKSHISQHNARARRPPRSIRRHPRRPAVQARRLPWQLPGQPPQAQSRGCSLPVASLVGPRRAATADRALLTHSQVLHFPTSSGW